MADVTFLACPYCDYLTSVPGPARVYQRPCPSCAYPLSETTLAEAITLMRGVWQRGGGQAASLREPSAPE